MSEHTHAGMVRHCDVVVIGGGAAGLDAALGFARDRRSVIVVDADPVPAPDVAALREEVRSHGGEVVPGTAGSPVRLDGSSWRVELSGGNALVAPRVLLAAGPDGVVEVGDPDEVRAAEAAGEAEAPGEEAASAAASARTADWDHRYGGEQVWSGNPNGSLVAEVSGLAPGRALDVGAGEGGDAVWLAGRGWAVTASDISARALERVAGAAAAQGLDVACRVADATEPDAFGAGTWDLVAAHYASIPRTPDDTGVRNLIGAVAPGGTLLVVGHDLEPMRTPIDTAQASRAFDPDAYVRVADVADAVRAAPGWDIGVHERRPRPPGAASAGHHVDDEVLRARRRPI